MLRSLSTRSPRFIIQALALLVITVLLWPGCNQDSAVADLPKEIDFNFHIRPILSSNCFTCHGPDPSSREGGLRLDLADSAYAVLASGNQAIVPGHWRESELIKRVTSQDPDLQMPPPEMQKQLSKQEVALLKKWITQGAEWKTYWAFIPPENKTPPKVRNKKAVANAIDPFVLAELERRKLEPAPPAEKQQLIRRVSYLLTGLPPRPEEIDQFVYDNSPDAYEKLVDRLLASPHFGERWARHWMDLMRYAETKGHEFDYPVVGAWRYRDYLIRAFNADLPYDQLIREHLAGDILESPRYHPEKGFNESILGPIYFSLGEGKHSPVDTRKEEVDRIDNIIDVTSKTFQGLTVACARCHDHKFDPIPTADYYSLYGILESTRFTPRPASLGLPALEKIDSIQAFKKNLRQFIAAKALNSEVSLAQAKTIALKTTPSLPDSSSGYRMIGDFRSGTMDGWFSDGIAFNGQNMLGTPLFQDDRLIGFETGKASSKILAKGIMGALRSPTFTIEEGKFAVRAAGQHSTLRIIMDNFQLIQNPIYGGLQKKVEKANMETYVFDLSQWKGHKAYIEILPGESVSRDGKSHYYDIAPDAWIEVEWAIAFKGELPEVQELQIDKPLPQAKTALQNWVAGTVAPADVQVLEKLLAEGLLNRTANSLKSAIEKNQSLASELYDSTFIAGVTEGDAIFSSVFIRGNHLEESDEKESHRFFTALKDFSPPFSQEGSGRMDLANAIASPNNPLTARVMCNRIWHHLFGRGIVETVDNFGLLGKAPSNPDLLDHLAIRFVEDGWSIKRMIRYILLSNTFKQSTQASEKSQEVDPENIWLSRFPIRRLEAEAIRDGMLSVSGRLDPRLFGEPIPVHLTEFMKGRGRPATSGPLDGAGRRSIYQAIPRNFLPPLMLTFDMPVPFTTFGKRNVSNVPAQSLSLLNDPFVTEQADYWAENLLKEEGTFEQSIEKIYQTAFARSAKPEEIEQARQFFKDQAKTYDLSEDEWLKNKQLWTDFCHAVFNMKEFIFLI